jgi:hypothetical protein
MQSSGEFPEITQSGATQMTSHKYVLDEHGNPKVEPDLIKWGTWFERADRHVGQTLVGDTKVSTVFLGLDHNFSNSGPPVLWETMVFGGPLDMEQKRCSGSREQAEAMHLNMVQYVKTKEHEANESF